MSPQRDSSNVPITLLSFIYNTTGAPAYRTEMHMDMQTAFKRFDVAEPATQTTCFEVELAAYNLRVFSSDAAATLPNDERYGEARKALDGSAEGLFTALKPALANLVMSRQDPMELAREIDPTTNATDRIGFGPISIAGGKVVVSGQPEHLVLDYLYYYFHFQKARAAIKAQPAGLLGALKSALGRDAMEEMAAIIRLGDIMDSADPLPSDETPLKRDVALVCLTLGREYAQKGWLECW